MTDRLADEIGPDGSMRNTVPVPLLLRLFLGAAGAAVVVPATLSLWRGVIPLNVMTPFFGGLLLAAWVIGGMLLRSAILAPGATWTIVPGKVVIHLAYPFWQRTLVLTREQIVDIAVQETEWERGDTSFAVNLQTASGATYRSRPLGSRDVAEGFRARLIERLNA